MRTHVLFGLSHGGALKIVLESYQINDHVVVMVDDLMWGPLGNVLSDHVQAVRLNWWGHEFYPGDNETPSQTSRKKILLPIPAFGKVIWANQLNVGILEK